MKQFMRKFGLRILGADKKTTKKPVNRSGLMRAMNQAAPIEHIHVGGLGDTRHSYAEAMRKLQEIAQAQRELAQRLED